MKKVVLFILLLTVTAISRAQADHDHHPVPQGPSGGGHQPPPHHPPQNPPQNPPQHHPPSGGYHPGPYHPGPYYPPHHYGPYYPGTYYPIHHTPVYIPPIYHPPVTQPVWNVSQADSTVLQLENATINTYRIALNETHVGVDSIKDLAVHRLLDVINSAKALRSQIHKYPQSPVYTGSEYRNLKRDFEEARLSVYQATFSQSVDASFAKVEKQLLRLNQIYWNN